MHRHHHQPGGGDQEPGERILRFRPHAASCTEEDRQYRHHGRRGRCFYIRRPTNTDLQLTCRDAIPEFSFDAVQIKRVLINLLDNAVSVLADGGVIEVTFSSMNQPDRTWLEVADNGPGITDEVKLRLFEPYFSTRKSGTGLGLAIAHTIVTEHNGAIRVHDNRPHGRGVFG